MFSFVTCLCNLWTFGDEVWYSFIFFSAELTFAVSTDSLDLSFHHFGLECLFLCSKNHYHWEGWQSKFLNWSGFGVQAESDRVWFKDGHEHQFSGSCWFVLRINKRLALPSHASSSRYPRRGSTRRRWGRGARALPLSGHPPEEVGWVVLNSCLTKQRIGMNHEKWWFVPISSQDHARLNWDLVWSTRLISELNWDLPLIYFSNNKNIIALHYSCNLNSFCSMTA